MESWETSVICFAEIDCEYGTWSTQLSNNNNFMETSHFPHLSFFYKSLTFN